MRKTLLAGKLLVALILGPFMAGQTPALLAQDLARISKIIGSHDAVLLADPNQKIIVSKNIDKKLIPASTLKILTALVGLQYLGSDYRFVTEFYTNPNFDLKVKGYGDPVLISETLAQIAHFLKPQIRRFKDLVLDGTYFATPLVIPGITSSPNPYDAPNGALCANFNTVYFKRTQKGNYVSAEPQTPLLPFALKIIKNRSLKQERVIIPGEKNQHTLYAGHLLKHFLVEKGIQTSGTIKLGPVLKTSDRLILRYRSNLSLIQVVARLLEFSNNFIANQILVSTGARVLGAPGTLDKGVNTLLTYARRELAIDDLNIVEGSGISRKNRISARSMLKVLNKFEPYYRLLPSENGAYFKTGSLYGIRTRAGYIEAEDGRLFRFVVLLNTPGKTTQPIMQQLQRIVANLP